MGTRRSKKRMGSGICDACSVVWDYQLEQLREEARAEAENRLRESITANIADRLRRESEELKPDGKDRAAALSLVQDMDNDIGSLITLTSERAAAAASKATLWRWTANLGGTLCLAAMVQLPLPSAATATILSIALFMTNFVANAYIGLRDQRRLVLGRLVQLQAYIRDAKRKIANTTSRSHIETYVDYIVRERNKLVDRVPLDAHRLQRIRVEQTKQRIAEIDVDELIGREEDDEATPVASRHSG